MTLKELTVPTTNNNRIYRININKQRQAGNPAFFKVHFAYPFHFSSSRIGIRLIKNIKKGRRFPTSVTDVVTDVVKAGEELEGDQDGCCQCGAWKLRLQPHPCRVCQEGQQRLQGQEQPGERVVVKLVKKKFDNTFDMWVERWDMCLGNGAD